MSPELKGYIEANKLNVIFTKEKIFFGSYRNVKVLIGTSPVSFMNRSKGMDRETTIFIVNDTRFEILMDLKFISKGLSFLNIHNSLHINNLLIKVR